MTDDVRDPLTAGLVPGQGGPVDAELRTFLIADVRGYTSFTHRHGDEMAATLAGKFARVTREVVETESGSVLELRGDEALCVFTSPRRAVRAAVALQRRFVDESRWDPELPLPVGIGLDFGEAVPVEGGYRSGALNLAARLCSIAQPGEILATPELTHVARRLDGMSYVADDPVRFKGLSDPVRPVRVVPDGEDPTAQLAALGALPPREPAQAGPSWLPTPVRRHPRLSGVAVLVAAALVAAGLVVTMTAGSETSLSRLHENVVAALDIGSGRLVTQTSVGSSPAAVAVAAGAVWVANRDDSTVSRLDIATGRVTQTTDVGLDPVALAVGAGAVWVADSGSGSVAKLDPASGRVLQTVSVGSAPSALAFDGRMLWAVDTIGGALFRIDPGHGTAALVHHVDPSPGGVAAARGQVWVSSSGSNSVTQLDATSGRVVQSVHVGNDPRGIALVGDSLWVTNNLDGTVTRINTETADVVATLPVGGGPVAVAGSTDAVWVANADGLSITRIDPRANRVVSSIRTASAPSGIALAGDRLWLSAGTDPALHVGGTLTAALSEPVALDPATGYDYDSEAVDALMYDGLLGLRRTAGAAGGTVVPDLARSLPSVSDAGRTYTFRMRSGIRWSDGKPVTGEDVRRGLERTVAARIWPLYGGIVGADACTRKACDLSKGIRVDDAAGVVAIRLARPDSEFLYKLAVLGAVAVPVHTPIGPLGDTVLPSTGPYVVDRYAGKRLTLTRNPRFRQWSAAAQPAGYPERLVFSVHPGAGPGDDTWSPANVDWGNYIAVPNAAALQARLADRVRLTPDPAVQSIFLNASHPPFDDVRARRAVAFALDRSALAANWISPGQVTCQNLPPLVPGYQSYCPYTLRPDAAGDWHAPDLATAQRLVRASGTRGALVHLDVPAGFTPTHDIAGAMRSLGYRVRVVTLPLRRYFPALIAEYPHVEAGFNGWGADYPAASNFLETQFSCDERDLAGGAGSNFSQFCDPRIDRQMTAASKLQVRSPGAALARWGRIDRELVDAAPQIGLIVPTHVTVVSARLQHAERNPVFGPLYDQAWVR